MQIPKQKKESSWPLTNFAMKEIFRLISGRSYGLTCNGLMSIFLCRLRSRIEEMKEPFHGSSRSRKSVFPESGPWSTSWRRTVSQLLRSLLRIRATLFTRMNFKLSHGPLEQLLSSNFAFSPALPDKRRHRYVFPAPLPGRVSYRLQPPGYVASHRPQDW